MSAGARAAAVQMMAEFAIMDADVLAHCFDAYAADKDREIAALRAQLQVAHDIGGTFWEALKPLNLQRINVSNPGAHVTELIEALRRAKEEVSVELGVSAQRAERDRAEIAALRAELKGAIPHLRRYIKMRDDDDPFDTGLDVPLQLVKRIDALLAPPTVQASGKP